MPNHASHRLNSWKEIALYLQVETRTAMRWEVLRGLPVHRIPGGKRNAVYAYREEIDAWLRGHAPAAEENVENQGVKSEKEGTADENRAPKTEYRGTSRRMVWAIQVAMVVLAVMAAVLLVRGNRGGKPELVRADFAGEKLVAWDARDREVWSKEFPGLLEKADRGVWNANPSRVRLVDINGDGQREVLAVTHVRTGGGRDDRYDVRLLCYSSDGHVLWEYRPEKTWRFSGRDFAGPWVIYDVHVVTKGPGHGIWLAMNHHTWWPAFVVRLDGSGKEEVRFVNSGSIFRLNLIETQKGTFLLAGGVNNEPYAGALAMLDVTAPPAVSPQSPEQEFHCQNCPSGRPFAYYVLPRSEVNLKWPDQSHNGVFEIRKEGQAVMAITMEADPAAHALYRFSLAPDIRLTEVNFSDGYWQYHRQLEQNGKLHHADKACPYRLRPQSVRFWAPENNWLELPVPAS
jgi:hypothetical protein